MNMHKILVKYVKTSEYSLISKDYQKNEFYI